MSQTLYLIVELILEGSGAVIAPLFYKPCDRLSRIGHSHLIVINRLKTLFVEIAERGPTFLACGWEDFVGKIRLFH
jgi:hypothetical protein